MKRRVLIAAGATGGHFYPGFSVAKILKARGYEVLFLLPESTRRRGVEAIEQVEAAGMDVLEVDVEPFSRLPGPSWVRFAVKQFQALAMIRAVVRSWDPCAVLGMGSFLSFPAIVSASSLGVPALIHEQNAKLGLANRVSLPFSTRLAMGLPILALAPRANTIWTGIPVRPEMGTPPDAAGARARFGLDPEKTTLVAVGGSQGALGINTLLPEAFKRLRAQGADLQVLHLAGRRHVEAAREAYAGVDGAVVLDYLDDMPAAYAAADLVLSRSGAGTLAEIQTLRKPALLIPFPHAAGRHQHANAGTLGSLGAARVIDEGDLDAAALARALEELLGGRGGLESLRRAFRLANLPDHVGSAERLARLVEVLGAGAPAPLWITL